MKNLLILFVLLYSFPAYSQNGKKDKGPSQEDIYQIRKDADAAFVIIVQSIVPDTCRTSSTEETFVITGKIIKKYFDKTGKFKEQTITFISADTSAYSMAPHNIVFVNKANPNIIEKCKEVLWTSKSGNAFPFSSKTEVMVGKKQN